VQTSPLFPGATALEAVTPGSVDSLTMCAPPGTLERRSAIALALRALKPGAELAVMAPKDKGGSRLAKELVAFGCTVEEHSRRHQRICFTARPADPVELQAAIEAGAARLDEKLGLWTQPGVFSWDRIDPGTALLMSVLPSLHGNGADFGCGVGVLAAKVLANAAVTRLDLVDLDRRAFEAAKRNITDPRAHLHWADVRSAPELSGLDFVVMNPPFHDGGAEDKSLGQAFLKRAHTALRKGGVVWLVANRHLPYEAVLTELYAAVTPKAAAHGYKVYEARR
jgi:16S rRNA (guanine1207-N2)-methyltransferase